MPKSILMYPDAGTLAGEDLLYLVKGAGGSDRDRKLTLAALRELMSERGADVIVANAPASGDWEIDVTNSRDLLVCMQGSSTGKVTISGEVPPGHSVVLWNIMAPATVEMEATSGNCFPEIGTVDRFGTVVLNRMGVASWGCVHTMDANSVRSALASIGQVLDDYDARLDTLESFTAAAPALVNFAEAFGDPLINVDNGVDFLLGTLPAGSWIVDGAVRYGVSEGTEVTHTQAQFVTKNLSTGAVIGSGRPACGSPSTFRAHVGMLMNGVTLPRTIFTISQDVNLYIRFECFGTKTSQGTEPICIYHALATHQPA